MVDDSIENVYNYAERAYIRMQAGDVLMRCLEDASVAPMQRLVESLLVAGPENIDLLREILAETSSRKTQVEDDLQQVLVGLKANLESYGVRLRGVKKPLTLLRMRPVRFLGLLRSQGVVEEDVQTTCLQQLQDARELVTSLNVHFHLLREMEEYLKDWLWGSYYQSIHQAQLDSHPSSPGYML